MYLIQTKMKLNSASPRSGPVSYLKHETVPEAQDASDNGCQIIIGFVRRAERRDNPARPRWPSADTESDDVLYLLSPEETLPLTWGNTSSHLRKHFLLHGDSLWPADL